MCVTVPNPPPPPPPSLCPSGENWANKMVAFSDFFVDHPYIWFCIFYCIIIIINICIFVVFVSYATTVIEMKNYNNKFYQRFVLVDFINQNLIMNQTKAKA